MKLSEVKLSDAVQESLVALLLWDAEGAPFVRTLVPVDAFGSYFKEFAAEAIAFFDRYKKVPGEHALDILETLKAARKDDADVFDHVYSSLISIKDGINRERVIDQAGTYSRYARANQTVGEVLAILKKPVGEAELATIDNLFAGHREHVVKIADPGTSIRKPSQFLSFLHQEDAEPMRTGIEPLDSRGLGPSRKTTWMFMANTGKGKSWCCCQVAKEAGILSRNRTLIISCEMSESLYAQRIVQSLFSVSRRKFKEHSFIKFEKDENGMVMSFDTKTIKARPSFRDEGISKKLAKQLEGIHTPLIIKQFPTKELTVPMLEAYMTSLEWSMKFIPDLVIIDYPDLFAYDPRHERAEIAGIYGALRGMAIRRNFALVAPTQANRAGEDVQSLGGKHVGFAYEKMQLADICITYNQTKLEKDRGLARLGVLKGRNEEDGFDVMISQKYEIGQFCLDAVRMNRSTYFDMVEQAAQE